MNVVTSTARVSRCPPVAGRAPMGATMWERDNACREPTRAMAVDTSTDCSVSRRQKGSAESRLASSLANMSAQEDLEGIARLQAKLQPERIRATLSFAGLYQMTHELIKRSVVDQVKEFYLTGFDQSGYTYDHEGYQSRVLVLHKNRFQASLLWLVEHGAITRGQADRLQHVQEHRHQLTHELINYVFDVELEPSVELFADALATLRDISRFWTQQEIGIGTFEEYGDVSADEPVPISLYILQLCIDAYGEGLINLRKPESEM